MTKEYRIKVSGRPRKEVDLDLLVQAVLAITEQRLEAQHAVDETDEASA